MHSSSLQEILVKEQNYAPKITQLVTKMERELNDLNEMHQEVMDSKINLLDVETTSDDINNLLKQQYSSSNLMRKQYESELEAKRGHQKNEYREWVTSQIGHKLLGSPQTSIGNKSSMFPNINRTADRREESFTIHLGSQLKSTHNIRIMAADITDLCSPIVNENNELMINGNIQLGIYSSSLCGVVCLVPSSSASQIIANQKIIRNSQLSTEFHFHQIDQQLEQIQDDLKSTGETRLKPGDFFITRHSNLSQCHLIFHLVYEDSSTYDMNSRHPCILGLRSILKVANRYDCTQLTIPALLKNKMSEEITLPWCLRRAELVLKCTKGFMIESSSTGSELTTLQLLLPADISDDLFSSISQMIPSIFRVANPKFL